MRGSSLSGFLSNSQPLGFAFKPAARGQGFRLDLATQLDRAALLGAHLSAELVAAKLYPICPQSLLCCLCGPDFGPSGTLSGPVATRSDQRAATPRAQSTFTLVGRPRVLAATGVGSRDLWSAT